MVSNATDKVFAGSIPKLYESHLVPLIFHSPDFGKLFVRSSWDDDASWFGYFDGVMQMFSEGRLTPLNVQLNSPPISLKEALICFAQRARRFRVTLDEEEAVFILGLVRMTGS